ncbi:MAG: TetR/AcrR family transcriptional regulator [Egibacteraceae bacterium]
MRRDELVEAAFRRVAQSGFEGLRLRQVADDVGIDHSTLHYHVATKQDLIVGVAEYTTRQFWSTLPAGPDPASQLRGHLEALRRLMVERPELFTVTAELDLRARRDPAVRVAMDEYESGWRAALIEVLSRGAQGQAWAPEVRPQIAAETLIAAVKGVRLVPDRAGEVFAQLEALLLRGVSEPTQDRSAS